jgi:pre-rRNA-processing protein TSR2
LLLSFWCVEQIADSLVSLYSQLREGRRDLLDHIRSLSGPDAKKSQRQMVDLDGTVLGTVAGDQADSDSSDEDDDDMEVDDGGMGEEEGQQQQGPVVDEDGFQLVQTTKGKGKKR